MTDSSRLSSEERWSRFRFSVIGPLLSSPPPPGHLRQALHELAAREWIHPLDPDRRLPLSFATLERWYYAAKELADPMVALRRKTRKDQGAWPKFNEFLQAAIARQYRDHSHWSMHLHHRNLESLIRQDPNLAPLPSYSSLTRYMRAQGYIRRPRGGNQPRPGRALAAARLAQREVRSFEVDHVGELWHLDFHKSRQIAVLRPNGTWIKPRLLAVMDDRSRLCCHAQFYLDETTETLCHGFFQALLKYGLPRRLMSDNGAAMTAVEFTTGLERCGILHNRTLVYSPHQNGKQETFWAAVEGSLLAMLEHVNDLDLKQLNTYTQAWINQEYHRQPHREIGTTPLQRYLHDKSVLRPALLFEQLRDRFRQRLWRQARRSDGTLTLAGVRFEIPAAYRHRRRLRLAYARWDLGHVHLVEDRTGEVLCPLWPLDKSANADGGRRRLGAVRASTEPVDVAETKSLPPLLRELLEREQASGGPPAYLPKDEIEEGEEKQ